MDNSVGLGGITLIVAAIVWLLIFVPGYTRRSQVKESSSLVKAEQKSQERATGISSDERLRRLINTQRAFSLLFVFFGFGSIASSVAAFANSAWWFAFWIATPLALVALFTQRAAGKQAALLAQQRQRNKQNFQARARVAGNIAQNREWTPNPLPAPLQQSSAGEISVPLAEVIDIQKPKNSLSSSEIDAILARRRAI
jgi:hypothetical protein